MIFGGALAGLGIVMRETRKNRYTTEPEELETTAERKRPFLTDAEMREFMNPNAAECRRIAEGETEEDHERHLSE